MHAFTWQMHLSMRARICTYTHAFICCICNNLTHKFVYFSFQNSSCDEKTLKDEPKRLSHNSFSFNNESFVHCIDDSLDEIENLKKVYSNNKVISESIDLDDSIDATDNNDCYKASANKTKYSLNIKKQILQTNCESKSSIISKPNSFHTDLNFDQLIDNSTTTDDEREFEKTRHKIRNKFIKKSKNVNVIESDTSFSSSPKKKVDESTWKEPVSPKNNSANMNDKQSESTNILKKKTIINLNNLDLKTLGFNEDLMKWINVTKGDSLISSSTLAVNNNQLIYKLLMYFIPRNKSVFLFRCLKRN
jgi:hypothetical protein